MGGLPGHSGQAEPVAEAGPVTVGEPAEPGPSSSTVSNIWPRDRETSTVTVPAGPAARVALSSRLAAIRRRMTGCGRMNTGSDGQIRVRLARPDQALGRGGRVDDLGRIGLAGDRGGVAGHDPQPVLDHVRLPFSQFCDHFQTAARNLRQPRLG